MSIKHDITIDYDEESDVMYITFGKPESCIHKEVGDGTSIKKTLDGRLKGFTIIDYLKRVNINKMDE